jgi:hypothetical protein
MGELVASCNMHVTVQEDTLDMDTSQHTEEIENLNPVRRSTRERRQPSWLRSGEFDICKSAISTTADWEKKVTKLIIKIIIILKIINMYNFTLPHTPPGRKMPSRHSALGTEYWKWTGCLI